MECGSFFVGFGAEDDGAARALGEGCVRERRAREREKRAREWEREAWAN